MRWHYPNRDHRQPTALHSRFPLQGEAEIIPISGNNRADSNRFGEGITDAGSHLASLITQPPRADEITV